MVGTVRMTFTRTEYQSVRVVDARSVSLLSVVTSDNGEAKVEVNERRETVAGATTTRSMLPALRRSVRAECH